VPCVAVTPTPTVVMAARWPTVTPPRPVEREGWPLLQAIDMRQVDPRSGLLPEPLVAACRRVLEGASSGGPEVVCVLNRRGRARLLACAACGELVRCHRCGGPSELLDDELSCRRCDARRPALCAVCGSTRLKRLRMGVKGVAEELSALLRQPVGEVVGDAEGLPDTAVVVGTEAVLHRVRRSSLVAFLDFDQHLLAPSFTAAEVALALLARAGRMVGGRGRSAPGHRGSVLVQTRVPDHEVVVAAQRGDPGPVLEAERAVREALQLPPAAALAVVSGPRAAEFVAGIKADPPALVVRQSDTERFVLRAPDHRQLCDALAATARPRGRLRVEVDPAAL
jgi:primosomal protein N' (replication factor Y)